MSTAWQDKLYAMVREALLAGTDIKSVAGEIYVGELGQQRSPKFPAICMKILPPAGDIVDTARGQMRFWSWSQKSGKEAADLYAALEKVLFNVRLDKLGATGVLQTDDNMTDFYEEPTSMYANVGSFSFTVIHTDKDQ